MDHVIQHRGKRARLGGRRGFSRLDYGIRRNLGAVAARCPGKSKRPASRRTVKLILLILNGAAVGGLRYGPLARMNRGRSGQKAQKLPHKLEGDLRVWP